MVKNKLQIFAILAILVSSAWGQTSDSLLNEGGWDSQWQASIYSGYLTGGSLLRTTIDGEPVTVRTDPGWLIGIRVTADEEYFGWEGSLAGVFSDLDVKKDPFVAQSSAKDATMLLLNFNVLLYPTGDELLEGRVKPYLTLGPGLASIISDFDKVDGRTMFATNLGAGIKFLLGEEGNTILRFDWRWHYMVGSTAGLENTIYRQELSMGLGFAF